MQPKFSASKFWPVIEKYGVTHISLIPFVIKAAFEQGIPENHTVTVGVFGLIMLQVGVNVGMNLGIAPTTGIPLPFMTYGGSNTVTNLTAIGLAIAVGIRQTREEPTVAGWQERPRRYVSKALSSPNDVA